MDSNFNSMLIAQHIQDRMAEATSARSVREAGRAQLPEPKLRPLRRWFSRSASRETPVPAARSGLAPLPRR